MSRAKAMGTAVETGAVNWLAHNGFPDAERLPLAGASDRGDIRLQSNPLIIAECKRAKLGVHLKPWMRELATEVSNAKADAGILIAAQRGVGVARAGLWFAAMSFESFRCIVAADSTLGGERVMVGCEFLSPVKLNSSYVPFLRLGGEKMVRTHTIGDSYDGVVCGPMWRFAEILRAWSNR
jgi:hypothetical protein